MDTNFDFDNSREKSSDVEREIINFNIFHQPKSITTKLQKKKNAEMTDNEPPRMQSHEDFRKLLKLVYIWTYIFR